MLWHLARSWDLNYLSERHTSKLDLNLPNYPSEYLTSKLDSNLPNYPSERPASKLDSNFPNYPNKFPAFKLDSNLPDYPSKHHASKFDLNLLNYLSEWHISKLGSKLLKCPSDTAQPLRLGSKKNHYRVPVNVTVPSNFRSIKCSTYRSIICRGRGGRLPLSVKRVLKTSRNLYKESTSLLGAIINLHTGVVARGTASWTQQARPLRCSFSFNSFHPLLGSGGNREKLPSFQYLDLGFR